MDLSDPAKFQEVYYKGYNDGKWHHRMEGLFTGVAIAAFAFLAYRGHRITKLEEVNQVLMNEEK